MVERDHVATSNGDPRGRCSRRQLLRAGLLLTGSAAIGGLLQACGSGQAPPNPPTQAPAIQPTSASKPAAPQAAPAR